MLIYSLAITIYQRVVFTLRFDEPQLVFVMAWINVKLMCCKQMNTISIQVLIYFFRNVCIRPST